MITIKSMIKIKNSKSKYKWGSYFILIPKEV